MATLFVILLLIIVGAFFWLSTQSGQFNVIRKRTIKASPEALFNIVSNLKTWPEWTPWIAHEPDCPLKYADTHNTAGSWYSWDGKIIGAGKMTQNSLTSPTRIDSTIEFTRPMRSGSQVYWDFEAVDGGTEVTWGMQGEMPFFFRWMAGKMDGMIGKDYEIGLNNLALQAGDADDTFKLTFPGVVDAPAEKYISTSFEGSLDDMPAAMRAGYPRLMAAVVTHELEVTGSPLALYHKVNPKKRYVRCDMAIPVKTSKDIDGLASGELPARRYSRTTLQGDYKNLEHAWHAAFSHVRMSKQKFNWKQPMLERYASDPEKVEGLDITTHLEIPLR